MKNSLPIKYHNRKSFIEIDAKLEKAKQINNLEKNIMTVNCAFWKEEAVFENCTQLFIHISMNKITKKRSY